MLELLCRRRCCSSQAGPSIKFSSPKNPLVVRAQRVPDALVLISNAAEFDQSVRKSRSGTRWRENASQLKLWHASRQQQQTSFSCPPPEARFRGVLRALLTVCPSSEKILLPQPLCHNFFLSRRPQSIASEACNRRHVRVQERYAGEHHLRSS